jgi:hypothetical protein
MPTSGWSHGANPVLVALKCHSYCPGTAIACSCDKAQNGVTRWASTDKKRPINQMVMAGPISFQMRRK